MNFEKMSFNSEEREIPQEIKDRMIAMAKEKYEKIEPAVNEQFPDGFATYALNPEKQFIYFHYNIMDEDSPLYRSTRIIKYDLLTKEITSQD